MDAPTDQTNRRLSTHEGLVTFLARPRDVFQLPDPAQYQQWPATQRDEFNRDRALRLGSQIVIKTAAIKQLREELPITIIANSDKERGREGFVLSGAFRSGKTTACLHLMREFLHFHTHLFPGLDLSQSVPIAFVSIDGIASAKSVMKSFARFFSIDFRAGDDAADIADAVANAMVNRRTRLIVVDEIQLLRNTGWHGVAAAAMLKNLIEEVAGATFVFAGKRAASSPLLGTEAGEQFLSRSQVIRLRDYSNTASGAGAWNGALLDFESQLGLFGQPEGGLQELSSYIYERTGGNLARLNELLTRAAIRAIVSAPTPRHERITHKLLAQTRISETPANGTRERATDDPP